MLADLSGYLVCLKVLPVPLLGVDNVVSSYIGAKKQAMSLANASLAHGLDTLRRARGFYPAWLGSTEDSERASKFERTSSSRI
jgi:hypothetical protein